MKNSGERKIIMKYLYILNRLTKIDKSKGGWARLTSKTEPRIDCYDDDDNDDKTVKNHFCYNIVI